MLIILPLLPLAAALWLAFSARAEELGTGWAVALVAALPIAVAALAAPDRMELPELLIMGDSALVLDAAARAALLLFGGAWLAAGFLLTRRPLSGAGGAALMVAFSGAMTLALAEGGPLVYAGMLAVGYGLYAVLAHERDAAWRRAGRALIVLLVTSDLLVFEFLLSATADPGAGLTTGMLVLGLAAILLRGGVPPAHAWLPPALGTVSPPTAVLLAWVPAGAAFVGALKLFPEGAPALALPCLAIGLGGAAFAAVAGALQAEARSTLAYAVAATAALLFMALPAGADAAASHGWLSLALLACCAATCLAALHPRGWQRDALIAVIVILHGLAAGQVALHSASALPAWAGLPAGLAALAATTVLTLAARRIRPLDAGDAAAEPSRLVLLPVLLAAIGLGLAWWARVPGFASLWVAPVGITLGLFLARRPRAPGPVALSPGDLLGPVERAVAWTLRLLRVLCLRWLPRWRDRAEAAVLRLWDGEAWSRRMHALDLMLRGWVTTSVLMLVVALGAAYLLVQ
jgi:hypothetical protein